jgi:hypothetical protein
MQFDDRREFQRLQVAPPIGAAFSGESVLITEVGVLGARIHHPANMTKSRGELRFSFEGNEIVMRCEIVRTSAAPEGGMTSGLRFIAAVGESGEHFRRALASLVTRSLDDLGESTATKIRLQSVDGDVTVRGKDAQFVSYRYEQGAWRKRPVFLPEQPSNGFTVARREDPDEMKRLCTVYEASDEEGQRLIRMFAELSVSDALQIPPTSS